MREARALTIDPDGAEAAASMLVTTAEPSTPFSSGICRVYSDSQGILFSQLFFSRFRCVGVLRDFVWALAPTQR